MPTISYDGVDDDAEDEDGGRTVVRADGGPTTSQKIVRRKASPSSTASSPTNLSSTSVAPAAVIRKTQDSVRASQRPGMLAPLPAELMEDNDEYTQVPAARSSRRGGPAPAPSSRSNYPPASYEGPPSHRPPPRSMAPRSEPQPHREEDYRAQADSFDDDAPPSPRGYAPPAASSSARNDHFARHSAPPSNPAPISSYPQTRAPYQQQSQAPYQQTMDVTGEGSGGYAHGPMHTGPPPQMAANANAGGGGSMPPHMVNHGHGGHMSGAPAPMSAPPGAMPAHFRLAQTGAITPQMDPPALTSSNLRPSSRPAISWAMALAAAGVFVGVVAVAITQRGEPQGDPQAQLSPAMLPAAPVAAPAQPAPTNTIPTGLLGASPVSAVGADPNNPNGLLPAGPVPGMGDPNAAPQQGQQAGGQMFSPVPVPSTPVPSMKGGPRFAAAPAPKAPKAPRVKPAAAAGDDDDDEPPKKVTPTKKPGKGDPDEETRKALEALQKAQLESSSSFK